MKAQGQKDMNKSQEKVLIAVLCGAIMTAAAGFAVQPALAAETSRMAQSGPLDMRSSSDWRLFGSNSTKNWANAALLTPIVV